MTADQCPKWWNPNRARQYEDGPARRGISDLVATILTVLDLDTIRRSTIRSLCPVKNFHPETGDPVKGSVGSSIGKALHRFERNAWVQRDGLYVHVKDRDGLRSWIDQAVDACEDRAAILRGVLQAAAEINTRIEDGSVISAWDAEQARRYAEVRRHELEAIDRLMRQAHTRIPARRLVHKGRLL